MAEPDWDGLLYRHPAAWVAYLQRQDNESKAIDATVDTLTGHRLDDAERDRFPDGEAAAERLLDELAAAGWLTRTERWKCPECGKDVHPPDHLEPLCPHPDDAGDRHAYADGGSGPVPHHRYSRPGVRRRVIGWLLALHGMNTAGPWQEAFNWLVSTSYGNMVPVHIFKYGKVRPGVLRRSRHDELAGELADRIRRASTEALRIVRDPRPDVIAHSFGTLLLGKALHADATLQVARVVTLGCILRPDFNWATLVERGQVEAVLNNYGTEDGWANRAHATIPDAGPAGRRGFDRYEAKWPDEHRNPVPLFNVPADGFRHSDFFDEGGKMAHQFRTVWRPFLRTEEIPEIQGQLEKAGNRVVDPPAAWTEDSWPRRAFTGGRGPVRHTYADRDVDEYGYALSR